MNCLSYFQVFFINSQKQHGYYSKDVSQIKGEKHFFAGICLEYPNQFRNLKVKIFDERKTCNGAQYRLIFMCLNCP